MVRFLRPGQVMRSGGAVWLVDESLPLAAVLGDESTSLLAWPRPQLSVDSESDHAAVADGVGIVVRDGEQIAWVRQQGTTFARIDGDLTLAGAEPDTVWFIDRTFVDPGRPPDPAPPLRPGRIIALHRDGSRTQVDTSVPVIALDIRGTDVWVTLAEPPLSYPVGRRSWAHEYPRTVLRVPRQALLSDGLAAAVPETRTVPRTFHPHPRVSAWLEDDPATVLRHGEHAGGLVWWAGAPPGGDKIERQVVAVGHDPTTGGPVVRVDAGRGLVSDLQAIGDELWLIVARRRRLAAPRDRGVDVLAVAASGAVRTIHRADSIDISQFAPVPHRPPEDQIREHTDDVRRRFDHLDAFWHSDDGTTRPLSRGLSDPSVAVEGDWPDTRVIVTLRHPRRPGLVLRRTLRLFDEFGAPIRHEHADIYLMEDLDTNYVAPAEEAVDDVLDT